MSEGISHWAEKLEIGDKCLATIRHKEGGEKNLHNVEVIVIDNDWENKEIHAWFPEYKVVIPYNELKPIEGISNSQKFKDLIEI
jgi:hypothetical protein